MALIVCENCGQHISERAVKCPKCGFVVQKSTNFRPNTTGSSNNNEAEIIYQKAVNCLRDRKFEEAGDYIIKPHRLESKTRHGGRLTSTIRTLRP